MVFCQAEGCVSNGRYGVVISSTGRFEKLFCQRHKGVLKGNPPPWVDRYIDVDNICIHKGFKLITTESQWLRGITECRRNKIKPQNFTPTIQCWCGENVCSTSIDDLVNHGSFGCTNCSNQWVFHKPKFNAICDKLGFGCIDTIQDWVDGIENVV